MVLVKRSLDSGINGYRSPPVVNVPRGRRSIRKRAFRQKSSEGGQICAFELLATVAGKLLEESECSSASSSAAGGFEHCGVGKDGSKEEQQDVEKPAGGEHDDHGSSEDSVYFSGTEKGICKEKLGIVNEMTGDHAFPFGSSVSSEKVDSDSKMANQRNSKEFVKVANNVIGDFNVGRETDLENGVTRKLDLIRGTSGDIKITLANKSPAPTNSVENVDLPPSSNSIPSAPFLKHGNNVKLRSEDNDEIFSRCSQPNIRKIYRSPTHVGDRRIKKLLSSKYWKTAPKLKDYEHSNSVSAGGAAKHIYQTKRPIYELDRSQRDFPLKKRRVFERSSIVTYDGGISCESVTNSPEMNKDDEKNASAGKLHEGNGMSSSGFRRQNSCNSRNSQVRLSIKSFKVPELFVEVPESTTVGSLKRTVLEAVTSILGGGLRVGVLLHGKKVRDDNRTLLQTGISQNDDINTLGFMLEPNSPAQPSPPKRAEESPAPLLVDSPKFVNRSKINPKEDMYLLDSLDKPSVTDSNSPARSIRDLVPSTANALTDKIHSDSKALVPVPEASLDALAVVPVNQRPKRSEIGQRRTRRPFSVSEVEALVSAVEKLGTGRWRDVKLCAFENAKHRTYVDLKDKWKTLVHTARISPQQRRGEPVPQELLDRVLAAQAYWSEHQAKQHGKQLQQGIFPKLTDSLTGKA